MREVAARYRRWGVRVSLFMDPVAEQIARAQDCGADRVELYTGPYADLVEQHGLEHAETRASRETYAGAARHAAELGLGVNAGHDLNLDNLAAFIAIGGIAEVSIGHALIADALEMGLSTAVRRYLDSTPSRPARATCTMPDRNDVAVSVAGPEFSAGVPDVPHRIIHKGGRVAEGSLVSSETSTERAAWRTSFGNPRTRRGRRRLQSAS